MKTKNQNLKISKLIKSEMVRKRFNQELPEIREQQNIRDAMIIRDLQEYRYKAVNFHAY